MSEMLPSDLIDPTELESFAREGVSLSFNWAPNPIVIAEKFAKAAARAEDLSVPLEEAKSVVVMDVAAHFMEQRDPEGNSWLPLSPSYATEKIKAGYDLSEGILVRDGRLRAQALTEENYKIDGHDLFFDGASMPDYWLVHQYGAIVGYGAVVPPRPYLGLSEEAAFEVLAIFDAWIESAFDEGSAVEDILLPPAYPGAHVARGPGGRFISRKR